MLGMSEAAAGMRHLRALRRLRGPRRVAVAVLTAKSDDHPMNQLASIPRARRRPIRHLSPTRTRSLLAQLLDELTAGLQRGEKPDFDALAARHPDPRGGASFALGDSVGGRNPGSRGRVEPSSASQPGGDPVLAVTARWPLDAR